MKLKRCNAVLLCFLICASIILSGCSSAKAGSQELNLNLGDEPLTLDPQLVFDATPMRVVNAIFEGLCRKDKNGVPIPGAAKSWDISEDKLTYTFYIRDDARWWDGSSVTANDFKEGWLRALDPKPATHEPSYMGYLLFCIKGAQEYAFGEGKKEDVAINVKDEKTLIVTLIKPTPYFLDLICNSVFMPVKMEFFNSQPVESNVTKYGADAQNIMGNGPFKVKEWNHNENIVLEKSSVYWNSSNIRLESINFKMITDSTAALTSFNAGEIDVVDITEPQQIEEIRKKKFLIASHDVGVTQYITINNEDPVLKNVNIRKALAYAIDRKTLVQKVVKDGSKEALGFVNPVVRGTKGTFREQAGDLFKDNDVAAAKSLLAKGLEELNLSAVPKLAILVDDKDTSKRDAQTFQDMWRKNIGVEVEIQTMSFDAMREKMMQKDYQLSLLMWSGDFNDPSAYLDIFSSANFFNVAFYNNPDFDSLFEEARDEKDEKKRMDMLIEAERIVISDMPVCPLYYISGTYAVNPRVRGLVRGNSAIQDLDLYWAYIE
ncbi:MAG: peptide ABC transporter substrate-binding protein [Bacillota bacterium]